MRNLIIVYLLLLMLSPAVLFGQEQLRVIALVEDVEEDQSYKILNNKPERQARVESLRREVSFLKKNSYVSLTEHYTSKEDSSLSSNILQADIIIYFGNSIDSISRYCFKDSGDTAMFSRVPLLILVDMQVDTSIKNSAQYINHLYLQINKLFERGLGCFYSCHDYRVNEVLKAFLQRASIQQIISTSQVTTVITSGASILKIESLIHQHSFNVKDTLQAFVCERRFVKNTNKVAVFNLLGNKVTYPESCITRHNFFLDLKD